MAAVAGIGLVLLSWASLAQDAAPVATARSEMRPVVERVRLTGTVTAPRTSDVSSEIASRVLRLEVDLADRVTEGAPLVTLDRTLERLELQRARAAAAASEAELDDARRRLADAEELVRDNTLPRNELDSRLAAVRVAEAGLAENRAVANRLRERLERHVIRAPFDGVVTARLTEAGEWVEPGTPVVRLIAIDELFVDVPVPERHFPRIDADTEAELAFAALGGELVPARVAARVPRSDPDARTFRLRLEPEPGSVPIMPGMSAVAVLSLATGEEAAVIPRDAVMRYPDGRTTVWTVARDEGVATVSERRISLGEPTGGGIYVEDGLEPGVEVVVRGNEALSPGQRVDVVGGGS